MSCEGVVVQLEEWSHEEKAQHMECHFSCVDVVIWRARSRKLFEGVEIDFDRLRTSLRSLINFFGAPM